MIHGLSADSGDGVTKDGLAKEIDEFGRFNDVSEFFIVTCNHHGMRREMKFPCEKHIGDGGIGNRDLMQLLCNCFALQKECEM